MLSAKRDFHFQSSLVGSRNQYWADMGLRGSYLGIVQRDNQRMYTETTFDYRQVFRAIKAQDVPMCVHRGVVHNTEKSRMSQCVYIGSVVYVYWK